MDGEFHFLEKFARTIIQAIDFAAFPEVPHAPTVGGRGEASDETAAGAVLRTIVGAGFRKSPAAEDLERFRVPEDGTILSGF